MGQGQTRPESIPLFSRHQARLWMEAAGRQRRWASYRRRAAWSVADLKNVHQGKRCFVIGNGPSLTADDMALLRDEITIASNGIFLMFPQIGYTPTYYTVEDVLVAEDRRNEIANIRGSMKIFPLDIEPVLQLPKDQDVRYVNFCRNYRRFPRFGFDFERRAFFGGTVTFLALQIAWYLGCTDVVLVGVDHSYAVPADAETVILSAAADRNHFDPAYFGPGFRWHNPQVDRMERAYICAREAFEQTGRSIRNATRGGNLEVFPRVGLDDLF